MKTKVFAIWDAKAEAFMQPFHMQTLGMALRTWSDTVNDPKTGFNRHPEDYTLFELGEYDEKSGKFENLQTPESRGLAVQFIEQKQ